MVAKSIAKIYTNIHKPTDYSVDSHSHRVTTLLADYCCFWFI